MYSYYSNSRKGAGNDQTVDTAAATPSSSISAEHRHTYSAAAPPSSVGDGDSKPSATRYSLPPNYRASPPEEGLAGAGAASQAPPLSDARRTAAATTATPYYGRQSLLQHRTAGPSVTGDVAYSTDSASWTGHDEINSNDGTEFYGQPNTAATSALHPTRRRLQPAPGEVASDEVSAGGRGGSFASLYRDAPAAAAAATSGPGASGSSSAFLSGCLAVCVVLFLAQNPFAVTPLLISFLVLYGFDLANLSKGWLVSAAAACVLLGSLYATAAMLAVARTSSASSSTSDVLQFLLSFGLSCLLFASVLLQATTALVATATSATTSSTRWSRSIRQLLSGLVPVLTAEAATAAVLDASSDAIENFPLAVPLTFASVLAVSSWVCRDDDSPGASELAPEKNAADDDDERTTRQPGRKHRQTDRIHERLVRFAPIALHVATCWNRMAHQFAGADDLYELALAFAVPNLLAELLLAARRPPSQRWNLLSVRMVGLVLVAFFSAQQRYVLALTHSFSYHFIGDPPTVVASTLYGLAAILCTLISSYLWVGSSQPDSFLASRLGEFQEDAVQLGLAMAGLFVGRMFGLPWNFTPLPILAFLGLTLWIATRMLRYLVIFLFVLHATGMVIFTYRFAGMTDIRINLVGLRPVTLMRFGFIAVVSSVLAGLLAGLAIRSSGGYGYHLIKRLHGVGILMTLYSLLLMVLEITLLKRPVPTNELSGVEFDADEIEDLSTLYQHVYGIATAFILIALTAYARRVRIVAPSASLLVISVNVGKAVCLWMDSLAPLTSGDESSLKLFVQALVSSGVVWVMFAPQVLLEPLHSKIKRRRSSFTVTEIPIEARRKVYFYMGFILPVTLICAIPMVLSPLASILADAYQNGFYSTASFTSRSLPIVELLASTLALWGLASLSMLNHYLPEESSGQALKKLTAFAFLIGSLLFLVSPLLGSGISAKALSSNPYAAMSSLGSQLMRGKQRSGAWGLLAAALATLLALSGPLELRERRVVATTSGHATKDRYLLFRTMIFGLLFGGGVAWFVVLQCLRDVELGALVFLGMSSLSVACMGTVAAVLGYFLELEAFGDAEQVIQFTVMLAAALLPVSGISVLFMSYPRHWFGSDGWLSTYLSVVSITFFATALCLCHRPTKNARTCGVANALGLLAWASAIAILFGRYGVSGLDSNNEVRAIFGVPASAVGTLLLSPMLLVLEGDVSARRRSTVGRLSTARTSGVGSSSSIGISLASLRPSNRLFPLFFGSVSVFLMATLYVIFFRGSGLFGFLGGPTSLFTVGETPLPSEGDHDLASLARLAVSHSNLLRASMQLSGCGFWTSRHWTGPILHLAGVLCCIPTLYLNAQQSWYGKMPPLASVVVVLPLLAVPILLCRGIALLQWAALLCLAAGGMQAWLIRRIRHESNMRI